MSFLNTDVFSWNVFEWKNDKNPKKWKSKSVQWNWTQKVNVYTQLKVDVLCQIIFSLNT